MIDIKEITSNIDDLKIIDPFTFKYITLNLINPFTLKFKLNSKFYFPSTNSKYYKESYYTMNINKYLNILGKIYNNSRNICHTCKKESLYNYCCNLCHEWFCSSCSESHLQDDPEHENNLKDIILNIFYSYYTEKEIENEKFKNKLFKIKFLTEDDFQKNWEICECENGGGKVICYCKHGLKCKNCLFDQNIICNNCNIFSFKELRYFYLDIIFLETELKNYDTFANLRTDIDKFNNNIWYIKIIC